MNKTFGKFFSNLAVDADEILATTKGMHKRNFRQQRRNQSNVKKAVNSGLYEGADLTKLENSAIASGNAAEYSKEFIKNFGEFEKIVKGTKDIPAYGTKGLKNQNRNQIKSMLDPTYDPDSFKSKVSNVGSNIKDYYLGDGVSKEKRMARLGVTGIGSAAGLGIGARFLSGGNITQNSKGDRDIIGIPFI